MGWFTQFLKELFLSKAFDKLFGSSKKSESNSGCIFSLVYYLFAIYFYLLYLTFILMFYIVKFCFYIVPKYLIKQYKQLNKKHQAFVRILLLPIAIYIFLRAGIELLSEGEKDAFMFSLFITILFYWWWSGSLIDYREHITIEQKEKVYYVLTRIKHILLTIGKKLIKCVQVSAGNIHAWGTISYNSTCSIYANEIPFWQSQKIVIDAVYSYIIY